MRLLLLICLSLSVNSSFAQGSLKKTLRQDFAESRKKPYSLHPNWIAEDTSNISTRDTVSFHNWNYYLAAQGVCKFLDWSFTSRSTISQSSYFPCVGHGYFTSAINGSGLYWFKIKEVSGKTYLKLMDHKYRVYWFEVFRSLEYDPQNVAHPVLTLVRLKLKPA
ncbi:hypothetical protein [Hymenobacter latericus]|uniref:hypothetical protein n=1 Tax=Hymenobacter sp. YIM 151858-1 TaxID=2987688 RepID=UPI002226F7D1|nr:hypothetical protein [Hymenobacter sp. YIM 151858-1]UYZ59648.1 hypothetical protein OIS50_02345 [Hymenobacter sp. YIM 151858-1]